MSELLKFSGETTAHKLARNAPWTDAKGAGSECFRMQKVLDVQWSNCPVEVEDEVRNLWQDRELGNDCCFAAVVLSDEIDGEVFADKYPIIAAFLKDKGAEDDENIWIHWWW